MQWHQHRYMRLHIIKVTVESSESEINKNFETQQHVQKVNKCTEKQKRSSEEADMRFYVCRAFHYGCKCIKAVHLIITNPSNITANVLNREIT